MSESGELRDVKWFVAGIGKLRRLSKIGTFYLSHAIVFFLASYLNYSI